VNPAKAEHDRLYRAWIDARSAAASLRYSPNREASKAADAAERAAWDRLMSPPERNNNNKE
jgi:hypothetical protein